MGGWAEPILAMLPESSRRAQLERELVLLRAAGIDRVAGFVAEGWEPGLASLFVALGVNEVFVVWRDDPPADPVLMDHIGDVVTIFPVGGMLSPLLKNPGSLTGEPVPFQSDLLGSKAGARGTSDRSPSGWKRYPRCRRRPPVPKDAATRPSPAGTNAPGGDGMARECPGRPLVRAR